MKVLIVYVISFVISISTIEIYGDSLAEIRKLREAGRFDEAIETLLKSNYTSEIGRASCRERV